MFKYIAGWLSVVMPEYDFNLSPNDTADLFLVACRWHGCASMNVDLWSHQPDSQALQLVSYDLQHIAWLICMHIPLLSLCYDLNNACMVITLFFFLMPEWIGNYKPYQDYYHKLWIFFNTQIPCDSEFKEPTVYKNFNI